MMSFKKLQSSIKKSNSLLCIGLDSDISKLPNVFSKDINGLLSFNQCIIEATSDIVAAYKINFAFYEQYGKDGFDVLEKTFKLIPTTIFTIADAKRGDIGNTTAAYATSVFNYFNADSVTVNPYMGLDSIDKFLDDKNKFIFILALTSNPGSNDFQRLIADNKFIYQHIIEKSIANYSKENIGFVIGATHPKEIENIRKIIPSYSLLIPGIGTQGGNIKEVINANDNGTALINVSRAIIYPQINKNNINILEFATIVRQTAIKYFNYMKL